MGMPGFTAEVSLSEASGQHRSGAHDAHTEGAVRLAQYDSLFSDSTTLKQCHLGYVCEYIGAAPLVPRRICRLAWVCP
jgi:hypothetical protein